VGTVPGRGPGGHVVGTVPGRGRPGRGRAVRCARRDCCVPSARGPDPAVDTARVRRVPRHEPRRRAPRDLPRRPRPAPLGDAPARRDPPLRLAAPRLVPDGEPLPPRRHDRARTSLARHAPPELPLRAGLQRAPRPGRPPLPRALRRLRDRRRRALRERVRVRARKRRADRHRGLALARRRDLRGGATRARARVPAPTSRWGRRRRPVRSGAGTRARARPASSCGSASCPRR